MVSPLRQLASNRGIGRLARVFHALSDETRLRIVTKLLAEEQCVCNLTEMLDAAQSRLSFHLKTLKDAGLVTDRREGRWIHYSIAAGSVREIQDFLSHVAARAATRESSVAR